MDLLTKPVSSKGLKDTTKDGKKSALFYARNDGSPQAVESGDIFKLTTENPESHPLPNWNLLEMQWFMQRLVAMSGAAGWPRFERDSNDIDSSAVLADEINDCNEDVYNWIPVPEKWSRNGLTYPRSGLTYLRAGLVHPRAGLGQESLGKYRWAEG